MSNREIFIDKLRQLSKEEMLERYIALLNTEKLTDYVADLEAKLAEKEKLIEDYSAFFNQLFNQDKISFAVEQLECLKKKIPLMSVQEIIDAKIWELTHNQQY